MIHIVTPENSSKQSTWGRLMPRSAGGASLSEGAQAEIAPYREDAPIHDWMPHQPQATRARRSAGAFATRTPNAARQYTGKGMPYLVPAWAFRVIGTSTMRLPRKIVITA